MDIKSFFNFRREDFSRETRLYFISALAFIIIAMGALAFYLFYVIRGVVEPPKLVEKSVQEKVMESLSVPGEGNIVSISPEIQNTISAKPSSVERKDSQEVLNSLSASSK
jgi:hypothetical protein